MSRSVLDDRVTIRDYWMAITLIYAGHDLVSITPKDRFTEFVILCPKFDYEEYYREYHSSTGLQIADAKAFGNTATHIGRLIRDAKRDGQPYINPDFDQILRDEAERRQHVD